jgi:hypothetical protein
MLIQTVRQVAGTTNSPLTFAIAGGVGLLLGCACVWLSPIWMLGALIAFLLALVVLKRSEIALLGILIATSSIVFEDRLPLIPIGIGSLHIPDIFLLASFGIIALRWLVEPGFKIIRTPLDCPLILFYGMAVVSTFIAILRSSVETQMGIRAIRLVTYYLTFFVVTNLVREERQRRFLLRGFFLLATIVGVAMIAQSALGESVRLLPGRVEALYTQGKEHVGITRVLPPGQSLILAGFTTLTAILVLDRLKPTGILRFLQWGSLGLAVTLSFNRSFWIGVGLALCILAYLTRGQDRQRLVGLGLVASLGVFIILVHVLAEPESQVARLARASIERLGTLTGVSKVFSDSSFQWRYSEYEHALPQISSHLLLGLGLGARYRPFDSRLDSVDFDGRAYIHNGHLWIIMKTGLLGYLALMWLSLASLVRGFKYWRRVADPKMRGIILGFTLTYLGVMIGTIVNPMFMQWSWTPVIGLMMGVNEVTLREIRP